MASDRIDEIIGQEVFDQIKSLEDGLGELNTRMTEIIGTASALKQQVSKASTMKEMGNALIQVNSVANEFTSTVTKAEKAQARMQAATAKVKESLDDMFAKVDLADYAMRNARGSVYDLAAQMADMQVKISGTNEQLKNAKAELDNIGTGSALDRLKEKAASYKAIIADTEKQMEQMKTAGMEGSSGYKQLEQKLSDYNTMLDKNTEKQKAAIEKERDGATARDLAEQKISMLTVRLSEQKAEYASLASQAKLMTSIENMEADSIEGLEQKLAILKDGYKRLGSEMRENADFGIPMKEAIQSIETKLKELRTEEFGDRMNTVRTQMRKLREDIMNSVASVSMMKDSIAAQAAKMEEAKAKHGEASQEYQNEKQKMDELRQSLDGYVADMDASGEKLVELTKRQRLVNAEISVLSDPNGGLKAAQQGVGALVSGFQTAISVTALFGGESEQLKTALAKVLLIQQTLNSVTAISNSLKKTSALRIKAEITWRKLQVMHTKAQTGALAAEMAATNAQTGATAGLTVAQKALNAAMKANPIFLLISAAAVVTGAVAGLIKLIGNAKDKQDELNRAVENNRRFAEAHNEARNSISKETAEMDRMVGKIKTAEKGSREWEQAVKFVAEKLGVSYKWLSDNVDKTNELADAWRNVRLAQALDEKATEKAAEMMTGAIDGVEKFRQEIEKTGDIAASDKRIEKASEGLRDVLGLTNEEVKRMYRESAAELVAARKTMTAEEANQLSIWDIFQKKAADVAKDKGLEIINQANNVTQSVKNYMQDLENAQKESAANISKYQSDQFADYASYMADIYKKNNDLDRKNQLKTAAGTKAYWQDQMKHDLNMAWKHHVEMKTSQEEYEMDKAAIIRTYNAQIQADTEKFNRKSAKQQETAAEYYKRILNELAAYEDKELTKSYRGKLVKLENQKQAELAKFKLTEEQKATVERLYSIKRAELEEEEARRVQKVVSAAYAVQIEANLKKMEAIYSMEGKKGRELSTLLLDIEDQRYEAQERKRDEEHRQEIADMVEGSEEYEATVSKYAAERELAETEHQQRMRAIKKSGIDQQLADVKAQYDDLRNILIAEGGGTMSASDELQIQREEAVSQLLQFEEEKAQILADSLMTEEEYERKLHELKANAAKAEKELNDERTENIMTVASVTVEAFNSIADSIKGMLGDSVNAVIAQQALSLAQVYMEQGVAIASAIRLAFEDKSNVTWYEAVAKAVASVALVVGETVAAFKAVKEAKKASARAQVSAYAEGTSHHQGGDAVVGEGGSPEIVTVSGRNYLIDKPTLIRDLPVGSKVTPMDVRTVGDMQAIDLSPVLASMDDIKKSGRVHVDVGKNVYAYIVKGASRERILSRQFSH